MRMSMVRGLLALSAVLVALVACATPGTGSGSSSWPKVSGPPTNIDPPTNTSPPTSSVPPTLPKLPHYSTAALIYAAVLGGSQDPSDPPTSVTWVRDRLCDDLIEREKRGPCVSAAIPLALQAEIRAIVGPHIQFTAAPPEPSLDHPVITLGSVRRTRGQAELAVDMHCGPLCGHGETVILRHKSSGWDAVGQRGMAWIS